MRAATVLLLLFEISVSGVRAQNGDPVIPPAPKATCEEIDPLPIPLIEARILNGTVRRGIPVSVGTPSQTLLLDIFPSVFPPVLRSIILTCSQRLQLHPPCSIIGCLRPRIIVLLQRRRHLQLKRLIYSLGQVREGCTIYRYIFHLEPLNKSRERLPHHYRQPRGRTLFRPWSRTCQHAH